MNEALAKEAATLSILVMTPSKETGEKLAGFLGRYFGHAEAVNDYGRALERMGAENCPLALYDATMGTEHLVRFREKFPATVVLLMASSKRSLGELHLEETPMDFLVAKPVNGPQLEKTLLSAVRKALFFRNVHHFKEIHDLYKRFIDSEYLVVETDEKGTIRNVNQRFSKNTGLSPEEVAKRPYVDVMQLPMKREGKGPLESALANGMWKGTLLNPRKGGRKFGVFTTAVAYRDESGAVKDVVFIQPDTRKREGKEACNDDQASELEKVVDRLREMNHQINDELEKRRKEVTQQADQKRRLVRKIEEIQSYVQFDKLLEREVNRAMRYKRPVSCVVLGIDHFDSLAENVGNPAVVREMLQEYQNILMDAIRTSDLLSANAKEGTFSILMAETDGDSAQWAVKRFTNILKKKYGKLLHTVLTVSAGVAELKSGSDDHQTLMKRAGEHLKAAREQGRAQVVGDGEPPVEPKEETVQAPSHALPPEKGPDTEFVELES